MTDFYDPQLDDMLDAFQEYQENGGEDSWEDFDFESDTSDYDIPRRE